MREEISFGITMIVIFLVGLGLGSFMEGPTVVFREMEGLIQKDATDMREEYALEELSESLTKLVAVDGKGNGVLTDLSVRAVPGEGRVLVDVDNLLFWIDTQQSIQTAKRVAENYLKKRVNNVDLTYTIKVDNGSVVGGPSAGAAFAAATVAVLENKTLKEGVIITGTIEEDGNIGQVGGIIAKGKAAKEGGYEKFLIPEGEKIFTEYKREKDCERFGSIKICNINYRAVEVDVEEEIGMEVLEVKDISEALNYLL